MKRTLILFVAILLFIVVGCSINDSNVKDNLSSTIDEKMGIEVQLPNFTGLDISFVYVSYHKDGEPRSVDIHYTFNKGEINERFQEHRKEFEEQSNTKVLYGPFEGDVSIIFSFQKNDYILDNMRGERITIGEIELVIQEEVDYHNFQYHTFLFGNNRFGIAYHLDSLTEEEALENTISIIKNLPNSSRVVVETDIPTNQPKLLIIKDQSGNELASNLDMKTGSATVSNESELFVLEVTFNDNRKLHDITKQNLGSILSIYFKDNLIAEPRVMAEITSGRLAISSSILDEGNFQRLADIINNNQ